MPYVKLGPHTTMEPEWSDMAPFVAPIGKPVTKSIKAILACLMTNLPPKRPERQPAIDVRELGELEHEETA